MSRDLLGGTWAGMTGGRPSNHVNGDLLVTPQGVLATPQGVLATPQGVLVTPQGVLVTPQGVLAS